MFTEIEKKSLDFNIGGIKLSLRYTNRAFLSIEKSGYEPFDMLKNSADPNAVRCFLSAGLAENMGSVSADYAANKVMMLTSHSETIIAMIQAAIILAMPVAHIGAKDKERKSADAGVIMTYYCDVMGRSEEEFWSSTLREVTSRWERYAVAEGFIKPAEQFAQFDD